MTDNMEWLDAEIRKKLNERAEGLFPEAAVKERIDAGIKEAKIVEIGGINMKNKKLVKAAAIIGACLALSGTTAYAVGHPALWVSHSLAHEYDDYADLERVEKRTGLTLDLLESFENGYVFEEAAVTHNSQLDDEGNTLNKYKSAYAKYSKPGEADIHINVEPEQTDTGDDDGYIEAREIADGVVAEYDVHESLTVPPDYEVSEEDLEREKNDPKFWISYGSDEVERQIVSNVAFTIDGQRYSIMGFDLNMTADEMFDMAEEIVNYKLTGNKNAEQ